MPGHALLQIAKRQAVVNPENTFFSVKRFIGRKMAEVQEESKQVGGVSMSCQNLGLFEVTHAYATTSGLGRGTAKWSHAHWQAVVAVHVGAVGSSNSPQLNSLSDRKSLRSAALAPIPHLFPLHSPRCPTA